MKIRKYLGKTSPEHLVLKFVRELWYQGMSVSCSRWASRMNLINSPQQQSCIIRWCCLRLSLAVELNTQNCVTSSGFPLCHISKIILEYGKIRFSVELYVSSVERVKTEDRCTLLDSAPWWQECARISDTTSVWWQKWEGRSSVSRRILVPILA